MKKITLFPGSFSPFTNGHLHILKWLRENGCPWNKSTCSWAAKNGHFETLKWLRANGCRWDKRTCIFAAQNGHFEILKWAIKNGCPLDKRFDKSSLR